jgi:hypothetical protein
MTDIQFQCLTCQQPVIDIKPVVLTARENHAKRLVMREGIPTTVCHAALTVEVGATRRVARRLARQQRGRAGGSSLPSERAQIFRQQSARKAD